jgi:DNA-binding MarR family transcriptional regulator
MTTTPTLNGQVLGEAEHAVRAVLDRLLADIGTSFQHWVALNTVTVAGPLDSHQLIGRLVGGLKIDESTAATTIAELTAADLLQVLPGPGSPIGLTGSGQTRYQRIRTGIDDVTARLYAGLPGEDLATAGRVLTILTARANAELAA